VKIAAPLALEEVSFVTKPASGKTFTRITKRADGYFDVHGLFIKFTKAEDAGDSALVEGAAYYAGGADVLDLQGDYTDQAGLRAMKESWDQHDRKLRYMHEKDVAADEAEVISSEIVGSNWVVQTRVRGKLRDEILSRHITGYSISGRVSAGKEACADDELHDEAQQLVLSVDEILQSDPSLEDLATATNALTCAKDALDRLEVAPTYKHYESEDDYVIKKTTPRKDNATRALELLEGADKILESEDPSLEDLKLAAQAVEIANSLI
jgi:hypothetical protein